MKQSELLSQQKKPTPADVVKPRSLPKPSLLTRMFVALVDFLLVAALFAGIETALYHTAFEWFGYHTRVDEIHQLMDDSHLYVENDTNGYLTLTEAYVEETDPEGHYDPGIVYFYGHDARALSAGRLQFYYQTKLDSGYFELDEGPNPVALDSVSDEDLLEFFKDAYDSALDFFEDNPIYVSDMRATFYIVVFTSLFSLTLGAAIVYLLVPLVSKKGSTPVQLLFKLGLADARDDTRVKNHQVVLRFLVLLLFNLWLPILLYVEFAYFTLVPNFVTLIMISIVSGFRGPHDLASKTYVIAYKDIEIPVRRVPLVVEEGVK
ncbi:MAG: RDD family protein [Bacilli bacterium]|jgi:hypothetical protein